MLKLPVGEPFVLTIEEIAEVSTDHVSESVPAFIPNVIDSNRVLCMPPENLVDTEVSEIHLDDCEDVLADLTFRVGKIKLNLLPLTDTIRPPTGVLVGNCWEACGLMKENASVCVDKIFVYPVKKIPTVNAYPDIRGLHKIDVVDRHKDSSQAESPMPTLMLASRWTKFDAPMSEIQLKVRFLAGRNDRPAFDGTALIIFGLSQVNSEDAVPDTVPAVSTLFRFPLMAAAVRAETLESETH
jgi:hypothetical protein